MPDLVNPYIPGQPVETPDLFVGRRDVLAAIREQVAKGRRVFVVSGARRMGKTSLLRQVPSHLSAAFLAVQVDLAEAKARQLDWLLWRLADAIAQQVGCQLGVEGPAAVWADFEGHAERLLEVFWPAVRPLLADQSLVLILDDLECLDQAGGKLLASFVAILTSWREQDSGLVLVLTTGADRQEALLREYPRLLGGALTFLLGPLSAEEATRLITWPVDGIITFDYGVPRRVNEIASGQPYYLQLLCFELFSRCAAAGWANQQDAEAVVKELVRRELVGFRQVWDESSPQEQAALAALASLRGARGVATAQEVRTALTKAGARVELDLATDSLERLAGRDVLERLGAHSYRFRVALFREWLFERIDFKEVVRHTRWVLVGREKSSDEQRVSQLSVGRVRPRSPARPGPEAAQSTVAAEEVNPAGNRHWLWLAAAAVLGLLLLLAALALALSPLRGADLGMLPTPTLARTTHVATATRTPMATVATRPPGGVRPSSTPAPLPSPTRTATPPVIVARAVPSIAYQSRGAGDKLWSIYVMNSDGTNRTRIHDGQTEFLSAPTWSPDGSRIAFVSTEGGDADVWVMDRDGSGAVNLTHDKAKDHSPAWSPDGAWIAFASVRDALYWELYLMRADGSDVQRLTWWEDASDLWPAWSPDAARLAFASKRDGNWEIYTMDRDGSNLMRLTDHPADDTNPAWSPDGSRIAFQSTRDGYAEVFVVPAGGGEPVNVSKAPYATDLGPTWSPDGGRIGFYSDRDGDWDVYVMNSDGSNVVKLTGDTTNDQVPAWRP